MRWPLRPWQNRKVVQTQNCLGFGCSGPWGEIWFSENKALALIEQALAGGITHFDTGNFYGNGEAERRLGLALRRAFANGTKREALTLSSKTGTQKSGNRLYKDFTPETIKSDLRTSLERLNTDYLDIYYLHGPNEEEMNTALPLLQKFQQQNLIRKIGICSEPQFIAHAAASPEVDVIMANYNLLNQTMGPALAAAKKSGKQTIAVASLAQGLYRKGFFTPRSLPDIWYLARAMMKNRKQLGEARKLKWLHEVEGWSAAQIMLAWTLQSPLIDIALINTTKPQHLAENITATTNPLPDEIMQKLPAASP